MLLRISWFAMGKPFTCRLIQIIKNVLSYTIGKFDHYAQHGYTDDRYEHYKHKLARLHLDTAYAKVLSNAQGDILKYPAWLKSYLSRNLGRELKKYKGLQTLCAL
jgi:hypothetical protein